MTVDEFLRLVDVGVLGEDEPVELLRGRMVLMSPQGSGHASTITRIAARLRDAWPEHLVREEKPLQVDEHGLPEPDIAVVRGDEHAFDARHPRGDESRLVVEVAWTSQDADRDKAQDYARAGVPLYWLVDLASRRIEIFEGPLRDEGRYARVSLLGEAESITLPDTERNWSIADLLPKAP